MKLSLKKALAIPFLCTELLGLGMSQLAVFPLLADEPVNISDIKGCRVIRGDAERLVCYDTVSDGGIFNEQQLKQAQIESFGSSALRKEKVPAAPALAPPAERGTAPSTETRTTPEATATKISVDSLAVTVTRVKKDVSGIHYFQTSDGQVWKQRNAGGWSLTVPFEAEIQAGLMGTFFLVNEGGKSTRVKRVR